MHISIGQEIEVIRNEVGGVIEIHHIRMTGQEHAYCLECGCRTYRHLTRRIELKHFSLAGTLVSLSVEYEINRCPVCGRIYRQKIPFKQKGFRCTQLFYRSVVYMVATCKMTLTAPTGKPVGFWWIGLHHVRTPFSGFGTRAAAQAPELPAKHPAGHISDRLLPFGMERQSAPPYYIHLPSDS